MVQAPGVKVNAEGVVITPEGMAEIEQRHDAKQKLVKQMRADREAAYALKDSHIGVQLARDLADYPLIANTYHNFAAMANYCAMADRHAAGRTLASLANGLMRGAVELYGKDIEQRIHDYQHAQLAQARIDRGRDPKPSEASPEDDDQGSGDEGAPLIAGVTSQMLTGKAEAASVPFVAFGDGEPMPDDIAAIIRGDAGYEPDDQGSDDEREPGIALRESVSPEPDETPQRKAARWRREAKRLAQQGQAEALGQ